MVGELLESWQDVNDIKEACVGEKHGTHVDQLVG